MSKSISISLLLAFAALALFVAGCGGGDDEATGSASESGPPTKAKFIEQADELCYRSKRDRYYEARKYRRKHRKELEALTPRSEYEKLVVAVVLPSIEKEAQDLDALEPPKGDEKKIKAIVTGIEEGLQEAEKDPYSVSLEVPSEYPFRDVGELISAYGMNDCRNVA